MRTDCEEVINEIHNKFISCIYIYLAFFFLICTEKARFVVYNTYYGRGLVRGEESLAKIISLLSRIKIFR